MKRTWLAILAPLIVMVGWLSMHVVAGQSQTRLELAIEGYDPRHLLSGHYLRFVVDYGVKPCQEESSEKYESCLCFGAKPTVPARANWQGACDERPAACGHYLRGICDQKSFAAGLERFYVAETLAEKVPTLPPKATIVVAVGGKGQAQIKDLRVEGETLSVWVERQQSQKSTP